MTSEDAFVALLHRERITLNIAVGLVRGLFFGSYMLKTNSNFVIWGPSVSQAKEMAILGKTILKNLPPSATSSPLTSPPIHRRDPIPPCPSASLAIPPIDPSSPTLTAPQPLTATALPISPSTSSTTMSTRKTDARLGTPTASGFYNTSNTIGIRQRGESGTKAHAETSPSPPPPPPSHLHTTSPSQVPCCPLFSFPLADVKHTPIVKLRALSQSRHSSPDLTRPPPGGPAVPPFPKSHSLKHLPTVKPLSFDDFIREHTKLNSSSPILHGHGALLRKTGHTHATSLADSGTVLSRDKKGIQQEEKTAKSKGEGEEEEAGQGGAVACRRGSGEGRIKLSLPTSCVRVVLIANVALRQRVYIEQNQYFRERSTEQFNPLHFDQMPMFVLRKDQFPWRPHCPPSSLPGPFELANLPQMQMIKSPFQKLLWTRETPQCQNPYSRTARDHALSLRSQQQQQRHTTISSLDSPSCLPATSYLRHSQRGKSDAGGGSEQSVLTQLKGEDDDDAESSPTETTTAPLFLLSQILAPSSVEHGLTRSSSPSFSPTYCSLKSKQPALSMCVTVQTWL
eukprot:GCRY01007120.1.p1 GENE.GCRY01007120.1~~GCRY01007120.1.p1  ORF type:complete len:567 (-),score=72.20 GCRY01007120.1:383-2083(-)